MTKLKQIKIEYHELCFEPEELMIMSICIDYPNFSNKRKLYLYELASITSVNFKLDKHFNSKKYLNSKDYLAPIILKLNKEEFSELEDYLKEETVYEEVLFSEDYKFLNAKMSLLKQDPKFWQT